MGLEPNPDHTVARQGHLSGELSSRPWLAFQNAHLQCDKASVCDLLSPQVSTKLENACTVTINCKIICHNWCLLGDYTSSQGDDED